MLGVLITVVKEDAGKFFLLILGILIMIVKESAGKFFLSILSVLITIDKLLETTSKQSANKLHNIYVTLQHKDVLYFSVCRGPSSGN